MSKLEDGIAKLRVLARRIAMDITSATAKSDAQDYAGANEILNALLIYVGTEMVSANLFLTGPTGTNKTRARYPDLYRQLDEVQAEIARLIAPLSSVIESNTENAEIMAALSHRKDELVDVARKVAALHTIAAGFRRRLKSTAAHTAGARVEEHESGSGPEDAGARAEAAAGRETATSPDPEAPAQVPAPGPRPIVAVDAHATAGDAPLAAGDAPLAADDAHPAADDAHPATDDAHPAADDAHPAADDAHPAADNAHPAADASQANLSGINTVTRSPQQIRYDEAHAKLVALMPFLREDDKKLNQVRVHLRELLTQVSILSNDTESLSDLSGVLEATYQHMTGTMLHEAYEEKANEMQGHSNPMWRNLGIALQILAVALVAVGIIVAPIIPVVASVAVVGGVAALIGRGLYENNKQRGLSKAASNVDSAMTNAGNPHWMFTEAGDAATSLAPSTVTA